MLTTILNFATDNLLIIMSTLLSFALVARYLAYRSSRDDSAYYGSFVREVERKIQKDTESKSVVSHVEEYMNKLVGDIESQLPKRKFRSFKRSKNDKEMEQKSNRFGGATASSVREYVGGNNSLYHGLLSEVTVFKGSHPPYFMEVTKRIMEKDEHWIKLYGFVSIEKISRLIDALPGMFIVLGIFGTFLGISNALPSIAEIDFSNFDGSSDVLSTFILEITFAMKTSIAGILCSLILTLVNTLFPIMKIREEISSSVESTLENLWYFFQGDSKARKQEEIFDKLIDSIDRMRESLDQLDSSKDKKKKAA